MGLFNKQDKKDKVWSIEGVYYGSHPDIKGFNKLGMDFSINGVAVHNALRKKKREIIKEFNWNEVIGFDAIDEDKGKIDTTQRLTVTRMATLGIFSLAAPKKQKSGNIGWKFLDVLHTTTGDISIESDIDSGNTGSGSMGDMTRNLTQMTINKRKSNSISIRHLVAENAKGKSDKSVNNFGTSADELEKYAKLRDQGVITNEEFEAKKRQLLNL